ncbi:hypothetical protein [Paenibacillus sp. FSL H3-0333]|uniref:hypothetical protein n=1 Tax=Paenibacillus sp. FSL H3-0333 TaxID=2921373 RepID=UPI0030F97B11
MELNKWLTDNINLISVLNITLTILLTALNVWFARNSQKYSAESLRQNEKIRIENNTPNLIAYFDSKDLQIVSFKLANIGVNAAKEIKVKLTPKNRTVLPKDLLNSHMLNEGVAFLAPGQTLSAVAGGFIEIMDSERNFPNFEVTVKFKDIDDNQYVRAYVLDLNMYSGNYATRERGLTELNKELNTIEKHVRKAVRLYEVRDRREREQLINKSRRIRG